MHKASLLIFAVYAAVASAFQLQLKDNSGARQVTFTLGAKDRDCYCLRRTQTGSIRGINGGDIKLFSKDDCTGNYSQLGPNDVANNAQWVNSVSFGASGIPSSLHLFCDDWY
ncbi:hypothetical protein EC991_003509 [Linnemannia zychae]|nr:hypothetical protein EC991_003509 [Linnemannia zychae]